MPRDVQAMVLGKRAVVFDLFHTLTSVPPARSNESRTAGALGVSDADWLRQLWERSEDRLTGKVTDPVAIIRTLAHGIDPTIPEEAIVRVAEGRAARFAKAITEIEPTVLDALSALREAGKRLALVSNADVMEVAAWDRSPLAPLFDEVLFSCHVGVAKPDAAIYALCVGRLGVRAAECVFVGDGGSHELEAARAFGMTSVLITGIIQHRFPHLIDERRPHADFIIEHPSELVG